MHPLDRPIWTSLQSVHQALALTDVDCARFLPEVSPFAATACESVQALEGLARLVTQHGPVMVIQKDPVVVPAGLQCGRTGEAVQMVAERVLPGDPAFSPEALTEEANDEMIALATLTRPGPFLSRTREFGAFFGVRRNGRLAAMAGVRLAQPGYIEVSGVCTHPDFRGLGLARQLSSFVAQRIAARGDTPYLHAYADNLAAIGLYESLGFAIRCRMHVAHLESPMSPHA